MPELDAVIDRLTETLDRAMDIWSKGGWAMWAIAVIALAMFGMGLHILLSLTGKGFRSVPESTWRRWIEEPKERRGPIGRLIEILAGRESLKETDDVFRQLRQMARHFRLTFLQRMRQFAHAQAFFTGNQQQATHTRFIRQQLKKLVR